MSSKSPKFIFSILFFVLAIGGGVAVFTMRNTFVVENTAAAPHQPVVYLTAQDIQENPEELVDPEPEESFVKVVSNSVGYLNVRADATVNSQKIGQVDIGDELVYTENKNNWYYITFEGEKTGWVSGQYVEEINEE